MKNILFFLSCAIFSSNSFSQISTGFIQSIGIGNIKRKSHSESFFYYFESDELYDYKPRAIYESGMYVEYTFFEKLHIGSGGMFTTKNVRNPNVGGYKSYTETFNYISIPLYLQYGKSRGVLLGVSKLFLISNSVSSLDLMTNKQVWNIYGGAFISPFKNWRFSLSLKWDISPMSQESNHPYIKQTEYYYNFYNLVFSVSYSIFSGTKSENRNMSSK